MKVLGFDTATDDTVVAALDDETVLGEFRAGPDFSGRPRHNAKLLEAIEAAAAEAGGWATIDRIAVGTGPGTFTGIRIAIATARGLSLSTGIPVIGVSTLAALAAGIARNSPGEGPVMPVLDARRGEVFAALYNPFGRELEPPGVHSPDELVSRLEAVTSRLPAPPRIGGPGSLRFREQLEGAGFLVPEPESAIHRLSGRALCEIGLAVPSSRPEQPLEPIYVRAPDARIWLERDRPGSAGG